MKLSKTNYLIYRDCGKNAWLKIHKPDVYYEYPLSAFEEGIIETGNEVDNLARNLYSGGIAVENRKDFDLTKKLIKEKTPVIYQPVFQTGKYQIACDILVLNKETGKYDVHEVKASNGGDGKEKKVKNELYMRDLTFQYITMKEAGVDVGNLYLRRLNPDYVLRDNNLEINEFFTKEDFTEKVLENEELVKEEMRIAYDYLIQINEPAGHCSCIAKGRSAHCTTFNYSCPDVPEYSVHDINRIGLSKRKLEELIDSGIYSILDVPEDFKLSEKQENQIRVAKEKIEILDREGIQEFLGTLEYPIAFFDYETYPSAIPRFNGYKPYNQIPFQFSLHVLDEPNPNSSKTNGQVGELRHKEFIHTDSTNPDLKLIEALQKYIPEKGSIVVYNKSFEVSRNKELAERNPTYKNFLENFNDRVVDLEDPFKFQLYVHPEFKGKTSIKYILPALVPELSYKELNIQEGATASNTWNQIVKGEFSPEEAQKQTKNLLKYCELDTLAMVEIFKFLQRLV